jgi:aconitate hydratase
VIAPPEVVLVYLTGRPAYGVGAQDIALAIIGAVFKNGFVKTKVMEFAGDGIASLSMDMRNGIDVMTTETACLSSIWETDDKTKAYLETHGRGKDYKRLSPEKTAYYDGMITVELDKIKPMIALPMHPSNVVTIEAFKHDAGDILRETDRHIKETTGKDAGLVSKLENGRITAGQGIIAGCAGGTFENIMCAADILSGAGVGDADFSLSVYPASQPIMLALLKNGAAARLAAAGAVMKTAFCGPCFGAGDVPAHGALSIRHTPRNFPHREGSRPADGQISAVALMDARSIAASARNKGVLTGADELDVAYRDYAYDFDQSAYESRVYNGFGKAEAAHALAYGPNITDWPAFAPMSEDMLVKIVSYITDDVTTTDELIPSGETSSYRSNPEKLSEFTLSRKDPGYVGRAKAVRAAEASRGKGEDPAAALEELKGVYAKIKSAFPAFDAANCALVSAVYANKPATAAPGNRRLPARKFSAAARTSRASTQRNVTAAT